MLFIALLWLLLFGNSCSASNLDSTILQELQNLKSRMADQELRLREQDTRLLEQDNRLGEQERISTLQQQTIDQQQLKIQHQQQLINILEARINKQDRDLASATQAPNSCENCNHDLSTNSTQHPQQTRHAQPSRRIQIPQRVAFTAYLDNRGFIHLNNDPIVYDKVLLNEGTAYNKNTGTFVCPMDGLYAFYFSIASQGVREAIGKLVVDGVNQVDAVSETFHAQQVGHGSNFAILSLTQGQQVWVESYQRRDLTITGFRNDRFSTFSGFLLY